MNRTIPTFILLVAVLGSLAGGCKESRPQANQPAAAQPEVEVLLAPVEWRTVPRTIEVTGTLYGEEEAEIASKLAGRVVTVAKDVGDEAAPGEVLAQIETTDYELALRERRAALAMSLAKLGLESLPGEGFDAEQLPTVQRARAEAANAHARFERARRLYEQQPPLMSEQDFADIRTAWEVAARNAEVAVLEARAILAEARAQAAAVEVAAQRLADTAVRAPAFPDGEGPRYRVSQRLVSTGEYVTAGQPMFRLVASALIKYRADVPERFAMAVQAGQSARVWVEGDNQAVEGTVARVSPRIDPANRMFQVEIHIPNPEGRLKPGAFARGSIVTGMDEGVPFVPADAVVTFAGVSKIYSVEGGKAVEHRVELGRREGDLVEIQGRFEATAVVVSGNRGLSRGAAVRVAGR